VSTITTCPSCSKSLKVPDDLLGRNVKCPNCGTLFVAEGGESRRESIRSEAPPGRQPEAEADYDLVAEERRPARRSRAEDDADEYDEERRPRNVPHRGGLILSFGIISAVSAVAGILTLCCIVFAVFPLLGLGLGIPAWVMGRRDLSRMAHGEMDDSGRGMTQTGSVLGIIGTILSILMLVGWVVLMFVAVGLQPPGRGGFRGFK